MRFPGEVAFALGALLMAAYVIVKLALCNPTLPGASVPADTAQHTLRVLINL